MQDNHIPEIPLRLLHEWDKINTATQRRIDRGQNPIQGVGLPHTRFGQITNGEGRKYKCHACQELFAGLDSASSHICPWETEFREYCHRPILQVLPGHSRVLAQRITELEDRVTELERVLSNMVIRPLDTSLLANSVADLAFNLIPGRD